MRTTSREGLVISREEILKRWWFNNLLNVDHSVIVDHVHSLPQQSHALELDEPLSPDEVALAIKQQINWRLVLTPYREGYCSTAVRICAWQRGNYFSLCGNKNKSLTLLRHLSFRPYIKAKVTDLIAVLTAVFLYSQCLGKSSPEFSLTASGICLKIKKN